MLLVRRYSLSHLVSKFEFLRYHNFCKKLVQVTYAKLQSYEEMTIHFHFYSKYNLGQIITTYTMSEIMVCHIVVYCSRVS